MATMRRADQVAQGDQVAPADLSLGHVGITPDRGRAGEWGTWTVRFTIGTVGMQRGGGIQVALPNRWHQWRRNASRRLQATEPEEPFFVSARAGRSAVRLRCEVQEQAPTGGGGNEQYVKYARTDIRGRSSRYAWVVRVTLVDGELMAGDWIEVLYGDRSQGSRGFTPPFWVGSPEQVQAAVDPDGSGHFTLLPPEALPWLHADPGEPVELVVIIPSATVIGEPAVALVVALDAEQNPVCQPGLRASVRICQGEAELSPAQEDAAQGREGAPGLRAVEAALDEAAQWGSARLRFVPHAPGLIRLRGQSLDGRLFTTSNASRCSASPPAERVYWGDLHSHSHYSWDGTGTRDDHFRYARDVAGLDVYGNADHGESLSADEWEEIIADNARYYDPGRFVTLLGYENSFQRPYQHHNVFYRGDRGALLHSRQMSLPEFWAQALPGEVLTIPHHTAGFGQPGRGPCIDWTIRDDRFRKSVEIYSSHGLSEAYAPEHPLSLDIIDFTFQGPGDPPSYVQDGWLTGQQMGVIASSDNHWSQPGKEGFGVLAVYAPELTRGAVFDAVASRRTYGTTGSRILLDLGANGTPMGGECRLAAGQALRVTASVIGTGPLRLVEVLRGDLDRQDWQVMHRQWFPGARAPTEAQVDWTDEHPPAHCLYYLRVRQRDLVHGRVAMAWSSPIWVNEANSTARDP